MGMPPFEAWASILGDGPVVNQSMERSALWWVTATDGRPYVVKRIGFGRDTSFLAHVYRVLLHLKSAGLPVAPFIVTDDAKLCVWVGEGEDTQSYVLYPELHGERIDHEIEPDADATCCRIGEAIGLLGKALGEYPWPVRSFQHDTASAMFETLTLPADLMKQAVEPVRDQLIEALNGLPTQLIQGDCNPGNVLLHKGEEGTYVSGLIDIDHLPTGQRIYDLCYYLAYRAHEIVKDPAARERRGRLFRDLLPHYVAGYHAVNPLTSKEISAIVPGVIAAQITEIDWVHGILSSQQGGDQTGMAESFQIASLALRWLCEQVETGGWSLGEVRHSPGA